MSLRLNWAARASPRGRLPSGPSRPKELGLLSPGFGVLILYYHTKITVVLCNYSTIVTIATIVLGYGGQGNEVAMTLPRHPCPSVLSIPARKSALAASGAGRAKREEGPGDSHHRDRQGPKRRMRHPSMLERPSLQGGPRLSKNRASAPSFSALGRSRWTSRRHRMASSWRSSARPTRTGSSDTGEH